MGNNTRGASTRKRDREDQDDQAGRRPKSPPGDSDLSLRGGSGRHAEQPAEPRRGVARGPTDAEWEEIKEALIEGGLMPEGAEESDFYQEDDLDDLDDLDSEPELSSLPDPNTRGDGERDDMHRGTPVAPIPINLPSNTPAKSTPTNPTRSSATARPTPTSAIRARPTQATATTTATPKQAKNYPSDFDESTPFDTSMSFDTSLPFDESTPNPRAASRDDSTAQRQNTSAASTSRPATKVSAGGGGDPGDDDGDDVDDDTGNDDTPNQGAGGGNGNGGRPPRTPPRPYRDPNPPQGPSSNFTSDREILAKFRKLEELIEDYVLECVADVMSDDVRTVRNSPWEVFRTLAGDEESYSMCRNPTYSPYLFQITIWNYLLKTLLTRGSSTWAADIRRGIQSGNSILGQGCGLGLATDYATAQVMLANDRERTYEERLRFFLFRKEAADFLYESLVSDAEYANLFDTTCQELIYLFVGYFKPQYSTADEETWTTLLRLTTDVVSAAWELAILMRRADGVWDPFIFGPDRPVWLECTQLHQRRDLAMPSGQAGILENSKIRMCVVPGLVKHEFVRDSSRGPDGSRVRTMRRICAKVFVDLTNDHVKPIQLATGDTTYVPDSSFSEGQEG